MIGKIRVEIGGMGLSFRYKNYQIKEKKNSSFLVKNFIRSGKDNFIADVKVGNFPKYPKSHILFESKENWRSYIHNGSYIFEEFNRNQDIVKVCILEKNLAKAEVYISPQAGESNNAKSWSLESFMRILGQPIFMTILHKYKGLLIHSTGIILNNEGIIFCGISGSGKTTLAKLWQKIKEVDVLSDDRVVVRKEKKDYFVYGTPWPGEGRAVSFKKAPLKRIIFLSKAERNKLTALERKESFYRLLTQCFPALWHRQSIDYSLKFCSELVKDKPCFSFGFVPNESAVEFIKNNV